MRLYTTLEAFRPDSSSPLFLALGNFDGLHLGHQNILKRAVQEAVLCQGKAAVLTFQEHPQQILQSRSAAPRLLTSPLHKLGLLRESKIDLCFFLSFTTEFSRLEPEAFINQILVKQLHVHKVYMGFNAHFGHRRRGDVNLMRLAAGRLAFDFEEVPPVKIQNEYVSSSKIRELVSLGRLEEVKTLLGRPFSIWGKVVRGNGRGALLGYPTANLKAEEYVLPPHGVYPVQARLVSLCLRPEAERGETVESGAVGPWYCGVLNYGFRPTFKGQEASESQIEVHLLNFQGDLYGKDVEVVFYPRLRGEKRFETAEDLKAQIAADISAAKQYFLAVQDDTFRDTERAKK